MRQGNTHSDMLQGSQRGVFRVRMHSLSWRTRLGENRYTQANNTATQHSHTNTKPPPQQQENGTMSNGKAMPKMGPYRMWGHHNVETQAQEGRMRRTQRWVVQPNVCTQGERRRSRDRRLQKGNGTHTLSSQSHTHNNTEGHTKATPGNPVQKRRQNLNNNERKKQKESKERGKKKMQKKNVHSSKQINRREKNWNEGMRKKVRKGAVILSECKIFLYVWVWMK